MITYLMMNTAHIKQLIRSFLEARESEYLEFKENNCEPDRIGKNISAISNSVALLERDKAFS